MYVLQSKIIHFFCLGTADLDFIHINKIVKGTRVHKKGPIGLVCGSGGGGVNVPTYKNR